MTLPNMPVQIAFDPSDKPWWNHPTTRKLVLLWKPGHITSQYFWDAALKSGKLIDRRNPTTPEALSSCLVGSDFHTGFFSTKEDDAYKFAVEALPYFIGEKEVSWTMLTDKVKP